MPPTTIPFLTELVKSLSTLFAKDAGPGDCRDCRSGSQPICPSLGRACGSVQSAHDGGSTIPQYSRLPLRGAAGVDAVSHPSPPGAHHSAGRRARGAVDDVRAGGCNNSAQGPPCKHKGRRLFLLRVGISHVAKLVLLIYLGVCWIRTHLPPPWFRRFPWLQPSRRLHEHAKRSEISIDTRSRRTTIMPVGFTTAPVAVFP